MERISNLVKQGLVIYGAVETALKRYYHVLFGMFIGLLIGVLFVPVYFRPNAVPAQMDESYREQWIKDTANGYQYIVDYANALENEAEAAALIQTAQDEAEDRLVQVGATESDVNTLRDDNADLGYLDASLSAIAPLAEEVNSDAAAQKDEFSNEPPNAIVRTLTTLGIFLIFAILGLVVTVVFKLFDIPGLKFVRNLINPREEDPRLKAAREQKKAREELSKRRTTFDRPPVSQFTTSYLIGDNYYDDSFAIEIGDPDDHKRPFFGETGAGISKAFKVTGEMNRQVVAVEAFLFDKIDGATITKVMMSEAAFENEELRTELGPRGELVIAKEGDELYLETKSLEAQVKILTVEYADADTPNYVFKRLSVEIAVWQKEGFEHTGGSSDDDGDDFVMPTPIIDIPMDDEPVAPPPVRQQVQPITPASLPPQQPPAQAPPMTPPPQMPPQQQQQQQQPPRQPLTPPPTQQTTQGMPMQGGDMTQRQQPFPAAPQNFPAQPPPQQPPQQQQWTPPTPPQQGQRPPVAPPQQGNRPPIPQQGQGGRPPVPPQQQGGRPPIPQQGQGQRPPMAPQRPDENSPFGDTGDFNL